MTSPATLLKILSPVNYTRPDQLVLSGNTELATADSAGTKQDLLNPIQH